MKISLLLLALSFQLSAKVFSQKISLIVKEESLRNVMLSIKQQSGYDFLLSPTSLKQAKPVTVSLHVNSVEEALKKIFENQDLTYAIENKTITIIPKANKEKKSTVALLNSSKEDEIIVNGRIVDKDSKPIEGVSVRIRGTNVGTVSTADGKFRIAVDNEDQILVITHLGYLNVELSIKGNHQPTIRLKELTEKLTEVEIVSTGYQSLPRERATGSFAQVNNELFNREVSTDVISRLNGIAPSLQFNQKGGITKLSIRGRSTIIASDDPLIVVDNFPYDGDISTINPNDVENVTFLRDAAAASIWGVRAGNGVIVITTKKGKSAKPFQVAVNSNFTMVEKPNLWYKPAMTSSDFIDAEITLFKAGKYDDDLDPGNINHPPITPIVEILNAQRNGTISNSVAESQINALRNYDVRNDISKDLYHRGANQQYSVNLTGGGEKYAYYFSTGYDKNILPQKGNNYSRVTLNANNTFTPIRNLSIGVNMVYASITNHLDNTVNNITESGSLGIYPYARLADDKGTPVPIVKDFRKSFIDQAPDMGLLNWSYLPLDDYNINSNIAKSTSTRINSSIAYTLLEGLNVELRYQYQRETYENRNLYDKDSYYTRDLINRYTSFDNGLVRNIPVGDILNLTTSTGISHNGRLQINYNKKWNNSEINSLAGYEARETEYNGIIGNTFYGYDPTTGSYATNIDFSKVIGLFPSQSATTIPGASTFANTVDRFRSIFANIGYTYLNRYTVTGSARRDESNLFGVNANEKGVPLWSTGLAWKVDEESFYNEKLPEAKLRFSYGENGNFDNTVTAYTTARFLNRSAWVSQPYAELMSPANSKLQWEKIRVMNIGLDLSNRKKTISGSLDYYTKQGSDMIGIGPINPTTGFANFKGNIAGIKGSGLDAHLQTKNIVGKFNWSTNFLLSYQTDKITKYSLQPQTLNMLLDASSVLTSSSSYSPIVGRPLFSIYSFEWAGLSPTGDPQGYVNGKPSVDYNTLLATPPDSLVYNGRATPPVFGSLRNDFNYKFLTLSFNVIYKFGYYFRRSSISYSGLISSNETHSDFSSRWQKPGDEFKTSIPAFVYPADPLRDLFYGSSSVLVEKGDNIRIQDIQLSVDLKEIFHNKLPMKRLQLYFYINNVGILWRANKHGIDPDYGAFIPPGRTYALGVKANL